MDRRFDLGRVLLVIGGALLLISLFLKWYDTGPTGWQVFEALDLVLAALAVAAIAVAVWPEEAPGWSAAMIPAAALFVVAVQLIDAPPAAGDGKPSTGAWVALAAALTMAVGAALALARISVVVQVADRERRRRVAAVDRRGGRSHDDVPVMTHDSELERTQPLSSVPDPPPRDPEGP
jgi:hypothetical protein